MVSCLDYNFVGDVTKDSAQYYEHRADGRYDKVAEFITINKYEAPHTKLLTSSLLVMKRAENGVMKIDTTVIQQTTYDEFGHVVANDRSGTAADMQYDYAKDSTDYCGSLILRNAHPSQYLFEGGYASFDADTLSGWHYYVQDYMGNNRMVVNAQTNEIEQITHYYPYGRVIGDICTSESLQAYKFEGKVLAAIEKIDNLRREDEPLGEGQDRTFGLDWYDIQARQYDAIGVPVWNAIDPLAEKYYGISPYVMCAGNPVNYGDYDGRKLYYAPGTSAAFKKQFELTVKYMNAKGSAGNLSKLHTSKTVYYVGEDVSKNGKRHGTHYNYRTKTINIDLANGEGFKTSLGYLLSPATALVHESAHAVHDEAGELQDRLNTPNEEYGNEEERDVITGDETTAAQKHGEIEDQEQTRNDHLGVPYQFKNSDGTTMSPEQIEDFCKQWNRGL